MARAVAVVAFLEKRVVIGERVPRIGDERQPGGGLLPKVQQAQRAMDKTEANSLQVRVELQAGCLAGVRADRGQAKWELIEPGNCVEVISSEK
jgi:predicted metalloprotease